MANKNSTPKTTKVSVNDEAIKDLNKKVTDITKDPKIKVTTNNNTPKRVMKLSKTRTRIDY